MPDPKLHHYVPQFHLRRFLDARGRLWVWDKSEDRTFATVPGRIAAEKQFYRLTQYEAEGHDPQTMEKQLSQLEGDVARITDQWLQWLPKMRPSDVLPIPRMSRKIVAQFLALQFLRTLDARELLSAMVEVDRGVRLTPKDKREYHTELMWDLELVERLAGRFRRSVWIFARNQSGTPLMTSDNPVAFRTGDNRQWLRVGIFSREVYLVYPMSPDVVLYCHPPHGRFRILRKFADTISPVALTKEMVESENSGQVFMASRFLISNQAKFDAERAFALTIGTDIHAPQGGTIT